MDKPIQEKAMLVRLEVHNWSGEMTDPKVLMDVATRAGSSRPGEVGRFRKWLVMGDRSKELKRAASAVRQAHNELTMAWDSGVHRLLPVSLYERYLKSVDATIARYEQSREDFIQSMPSMVVEAQARLGTIFNQNDYPSEATLRRTISAHYAIYPLTNTRHFIVETLSQDVQSQLRSTMESEFQSKVSDTVTGLYERLGDAVNKCAERLDDDENGHKYFYDSMVNNLKSVVDLMPDLNVTGDPKLDEFCVKLKGIIDGVQPGVLMPWRKDEYQPAVREQVKEDVDTLQSQMAGYFGGQVQE